MSVSLISYMNQAQASWSVNYQLLNGLLKINSINMAQGYVPTIIIIISQLRWMKGA